MDFSKVVDWIKLSPRHYVAVALASAVLLFLPDSPLTTIGLDHFRATYRGWIGAAFLLSLALLVSHPLAVLWGQVTSWWSDRQLIRHGLQRLRQLTPSEKRILRQYIGENTRSQTLNFMDGVVNGLVQAGILYQSSNVGTMDGDFAYNVQPWAWEQLQKNPSLLQ